MPDTPSKLVVLISVFALAAPGLATLVITPQLDPLLGSLPTGSLDRGDVVHLPGRASSGWAGWAHGSRQASAPGRKSAP